VLERADLIVHVGDFTTAEVLEDLRALAPVAAVHGNMDEPALKAALPARAVIETEGLRLGLVHDPGPVVRRHERLVAAFERCDLIVYGHTHQPEAVRVGETWVVNPGSPTERRRAPAHTMAVVVEGQPQLVRLDG
jgi:putative phosphoesterase